ncbi:MAG: hypothetical protein AAF226_04955 [Verrucomicrobiota bacterium]
MISNDVNLYLLTKLDNELQSDFTDLARLEKTLTDLWREARNFPNASLGRMSRLWEELDRAHDETQDRLDEALRKMESRMEYSRCDFETDWSSIIEHETAIEESMERIHTAGMEMVKQVHQEAWSDLWDVIKLQLEALKGRMTLAKTLFLLRKKYGAEKRSRLEQAALNTMPKGIAPLDAPNYAEEYRKAEIELDARRDDIGSLSDIFKKLLMIQDETPEEMASRRLARKIARQRSFPPTVSTRP